MATVTIKGNASDARTSLGIGTSATTTVGTGANNTVQLDSNSKIPALSGLSLLGVVSKIKQMVVAESSTQTSFTNTSYADGISLNITPSSTSSKILVIYNDHQYNMNGGVASNNKIARTISGGTEADISGRYQLETSGAWMCNVSIVAEDVPNTTSQIEYKHAYFQQSGTGNLSYNNTKRQLIAIEIGG